MFGCGKGAGQGPPGAMAAMAAMAMAWLWSAWHFMPRLWTFTGLSVPASEVVKKLVSLFSLFADKKTGELSKGSEDSEVFCMVSSRQRIFFRLMTFDILQI